MPFSLFKPLLGVALAVVLAACAGPQASRPVPSGTPAPAPQTTETQRSAERPTLDRGPATTSRRTPSDQRLGDENHLKIVDKYGGFYDNPRLSAYVNELGRKLAAVSEQPNEKWTFTVLDSPTVNAFALPGGYVYITRGLAALADNEAELAGVIGHEIGHVTAGHSALRGNRSAIATGALLGAQILGAIVGLDPGLLQAGTQIGQVVAGGVLADYSRSDELSADKLGIRYLARAGYDPYAQADFLERMAASSALDAKIRGRTYNPNRTDFLASHPATGPRTRQAIRAAQQAGERIPVGAARNRERFLSKIEGITFGDSEKQGFVDGTTFSHPQLGFTVTAPSGFRIQNSNSAVTALGPGGARFVLDAGRDGGGALTDYIAGQWVREIAKSFKVGAVTGVAPERIDGLEAAIGYAPIEIRGRRFNAVLTAIRLNGSLYRMTGLVPDGGSIAPLRAAATTFRQLTPSQRAALREARIDVVAVRPGDTVAGFARQMPADGFAEDRFRVLNGLGPRDRVTPGTRVKLVR